MSEQDQLAPYVLDKVAQAVRTTLTVPNEFDIELVGNYRVEFTPKSNDVEFGVDLAALETLFSGQVALTTFQGPTEDKGVPCLSVMGTAEGCVVLVRIFYAKSPT